MAAAGSVGLAGAPVLAKAANPKGPSSRAQAERLFSAARQVGQRRGMEARAEFLRDRGVPTKFKRVQFSNPRSDGSSGDVGTQRVDCIEPDKCPGDIDVTLSLSSLPLVPDSDAFAEVSSRIRYYWSRDSGYYKGGEDPVDGVTVHWEKDHWKVTNRNNIPDSVTTGTHSEWDNGSWAYEGLAFRLNDQDLCASSGYTSGKEWSDYEYTGVYLDNGSQYQSGDAIRAKYIHSWEGTIYGFGVSYPWGISVTASSSVDWNDLQTDLSGDNLIVY